LLSSFVIIGSITAAASLVFALALMLADPDRIQRLPKRTFQFLLGLFIAGVALVVVSSSVQTARANNHDTECDELWSQFMAAPSNTEFKRWALWDNQCR
jgi:hypothetical protein